jgi:GNAT superfamily N-acetyltransferase
MGIVIAKATGEDILDVVHVAKHLKKELGFVRRVAIERAVTKGEVYVARWVDKANNLVIGFANTHKRKDGWTTVYEIGVHPNWQGRGAGRMMLDALPRPIRLKCPVDNVRANNFYKWYGFKHEGVEEGKKRKLNVWMRHADVEVTSWECPCCGDDDVERDYDGCDVFDFDWSSTMVQNGTAGCNRCHETWNEQTIYWAKPKTPYILHERDWDGKPTHDKQYLSDDDDFVCHECGGALVMDWFDSMDDLDLRPSVGGIIELTGACRCEKCHEDYVWYLDIDVLGQDIWWDSSYLHGGCEDR